MAAPERRGDSSHRRSDEDGAPRDGSGRTEREVIRGEPVPCCGIGLSNRGIAGARCGAQVGGDLGAARAWYDVQQADVEELASQTKSFFIFLLGEENHYLVIPAKDLSAQLLYHPGPTGRGFYHLNLSEDHEGMRFKETPEWELFPYLNEIERVEGVASPAVA